MTIPTRSLCDFAEAVSRLEGGEPWVAYPYLRYLEKRIVEAIRRPGGGRLVICIPPRLGKSFLISKFLPMWFLEIAPERRVMVTSYGDSLAQEWGRKVRDAFNLPQLGTKVRKDVAATTRWETDLGGGMFTAGVGGPLLGRGYDLGVIDDPHKSWDEAQSPVYRAKIIDWYEATFRSRAEPGATIILIQQRLHEKDLAGYLMETYPDEWDSVVLPHLAGLKDPMGRAEGEPLCPDRYPLEAVERIKAGKSSVWLAMHQQRPQPPGGTIVKPEWFKYYTELPELEQVVLSWDATFKKTVAGSYVVGQVWGKKGPDCYLLAQVRRRMSFTETLDAFEAQCEDWPQAAAKIVEDKANGSAIIDTMKSKVPGIVEWPVRGSKESRFDAVSVFFRAGNVHLPKGARWLGEYEAELTAFPGSENDDQVDATSQALDYMLLGEKKDTLPDTFIFDDLTQDSRWRVG